MLRIIHTGGAYEVVDSDGCPGLLRTLDILRDKYILARNRFWEQGIELEQARREIGALKVLLSDAEQVLDIMEQAIMKQELKSCQKNTLDTHGPQDPH